jgi:AcrR family transcriptional regulator
VANVSAKSSPKSGPERLDRRTRAGREDAVPSRDRLLEAAARVFAERGYERASVDEIAAEAGLSKGTLYWNFKSKDELFFALMDEHLVRRMQEIFGVAESLPGDEDMSARASSWLTEVLDDERRMVLLAYEYWARAARDPELGEVYADRHLAHRDSLARALDARAKELGSPPLALPSEEVATAYMALGHGLALLRQIDAELVPEHLYGEILALVYQGLVARAERDSAGAGPDHSDDQGSRKSA